MEYKQIEGYENYFLGEDLEIYKKEGYTFEKKEAKRNIQGYMRVRDGDYTFLLHNVIGFTFIGIPDKYKDEPRSNLIWHHIDEDKENNDPSNLQCMTIAEHVKLHHTGKVVKEETRRKISESNKGEKNYRWNKGRKILKIDKVTGDIVDRYANSKDAERKTGINYRHIGECCRGKRKTAGGYIWRYAE